MANITSIILLCFVLVGYTSWAQQNNITNRLDQTGSQRGAVIKEATQTTLSYPSESDIKHTVLGFENAELVLKHKYASLLGINYYYEQTHQNIPIYGAYLKVNTNHHGAVLNAHHTLINTAVLTAKPTHGITPDYWLVDETNLIPSYQHNNGFLFELKEANGNTLYAKDKRLFYTDTMARGMVFNPDPLTTAGVLYGANGTYKNFNDSDYTLLNDQRVMKSFPVRFENGVFKLENQYCKIVNIENPSPSISTTTDGDFFYTRSQFGFKEVMAIYHIYALQQYLQGLGFNEVNYQLRVDAHASYNDQSYFFYDQNDTNLRFGLGGIPDAEDADVIVHEYTHAVSFSLNPTKIISNERRAIEEAICDVMACVYSKKINDYRWRQIFNWDGNETWNGRNGASNKTYLNKTNSFYPDSEIWSSAMNNLIEVLGEDVVMKLLLAIIPQFGPSTTMPEAAWLMYEADSILNNKVNQGYLALEFNARKFDAFPVGLNDITKDPNFKVVNTYAFAQGTGNVVITSSKEFSINVFDVNGKCVYKNTQANEVQLQPNHFNSGVYFIEVTTLNSKGYYKLIRN